MTEQERTRRALIAEHKKSQQKQQAIAARLKLHAQLLGAINQSPAAIINPATK
ncbi:hypothetical protein [Thiorhodospira sibirica]|uniref:hypothetical protein n=1 Tax=Thiorhodospira sibirica TaxID=154347 RepID=UPI00022C2300|nr:hypothetical protein [Thiorhodospira sibirica]